MHSNTCEFKQILAYIRKHDFAHPGEAEAIDMVFAHLPHQNTSQVLDIGCGLGGTAHYVEKCGWGKITGIDIDPITIEYAKKHYPTIDFYAADVLNVANILNKQFDIIYLFNSFYAFPQQEKALGELRKVTKSNGSLAIFDYVLGQEGAKKPNKCRAVLSNNELVVPYPIQLQNMEQMLLKTGWQLEFTSDLHNSYLFWYQELVRRIKTKETELKQKFGDKAFALLNEIYTAILMEVEQNLLSGAIIYARAI